jgi:2-amino-4-hydroxy-6-hydroxymethyldihydropteridine diphosphokinase
MPRNYPGRAIAGEGIPSGQMTYFLSLGSNISQRKWNLARARRSLEKAGVEILRMSSIYQSEPVDVRDQPWFLNQVLKVRSNLGPQELLDLAKSIERKMGRVPAANKGPRTIDIDILLAEDTVIDTPGLTIPHPRLARRNFVLIPLKEIAPGAVHPVLRKTIGELARESPDVSGVFKVKSRPSRKRRSAPY